jgi:REP element-mobilizing transposase RayT
MKAIYTPADTRAAYQLNWGLTVFWRTEAVDEAEWLDLLRPATERDGVRVLEHRGSADGTSQFLVSTRPDVSPERLLWSVKGRLQHVLRERMPAAVQRNYALRSIGTVKRQVVEGYIVDQLGHHEMADERVQARLRGYQREHREVDLSVPRESAHGRYWYNLHVVFVNSGRWMEIEDEVLSRLAHTIERVAAKRGHALSRVAVLPDHVHLAVGCNASESPEDVALSYMNNCAYACGMKNVFQPSYYVGTFGEYDLGAVRR